MYLHIVLFIFLLCLFVLSLEQAQNELQLQINSSHILNELHPDDSKCILTDKDRGIIRERLQQNLKEKNSENINDRMILIHNRPGCSFSDSLYNEGCDYHYHFITSRPNESASFIRNESYSNMLQRFDKYKLQLVPICKEIVNLRELVNGTFLNNTHDGEENIIDCNLFEKKSNYSHPVNKNTEYNNDDSLSSYLAKNDKGQRFIPNRVHKTNDQEKKNGFLKVLINNMPLNVGLNATDDGIFSKYIKQLLNECPSDRANSEANAAKTYLSRSELDREESQPSYYISSKKLDKSNDRNRDQKLELMKPRILAAEIFKNLLSNGTFNISSNSYNRTIPMADNLSDFEEESCKTNKLDTNIEKPVSSPIDNQLIKSENNVNGERFYVCHTLNSSSEDTAALSDNKRMPSKQNSESIPLNINHDAHGDRPLEMPNSKDKNITDSLSRNVNGNKRINEDALMRILKNFFKMLSESDANVMAKNSDIKPKKDMHLNFFTLKLDPQMMFLKQDFQTKPSMVTGRQTNSNRKQWGKTKTVNFSPVQVACKNLGEINTFNEPSDVGSKESHHYFIVPNDDLAVLKDTTKRCDKSGDRNLLKDYKTETERFNIYLNTRIKESEANNNNSENNKKNNNYYKVPSEDPQNEHNSNKFSQPSAKEKCDESNNNFNKFLITLNNLMEKFNEKISADHIPNNETNKQPTISNFKLTILSTLVPRPCEQVQPVEIVPVTKPYECSNDYFNPRIYGDRIISPGISNGMPSMSLQEAGKPGDDMRDTSKTNERNNGVICGKVYVTGPEELTPDKISIINPEILRTIHEDAGPESVHFLLESSDKEVGDSQASGSSVCEDTNSFMSSKGYSLNTLSNNESILNELRNISETLTILRDKINKRLQLQQNK